MAGIPGENGRPANKGEKGKRVTTVGVKEGYMWRGGCALPLALKGTLNSDGEQNRKSRRESVKEGIN